MYQSVVCFVFVVSLTATASFADRFDSWLKQEVNWIISEKEQKEFRTLKGDAAKEQFIADFWKRRDPTPDTPGNEYREEHYNRLKYVEENFKEGIPGWRTERGRVYIIHGPPVSQSIAVAENRDVWTYNSNPYAEYYKGPVTLVFERGAEVFQSRALSESREGQRRQAPNQTPGLLSQRTSASARYRLIIAGPASGGQILTSAGETDRHIADILRSPGEVLEKRLEEAQRRQANLREAREKVTADFSSATLELDFKTNIFQNLEGANVFFAFELPASNQASGSGGRKIDVLCEISDAASGQVIDSLEETITAPPAPEGEASLESLRFSGKFEVLDGALQLMCLVRDTQTEQLGVAQKPVEVTVLDRAKLTVSGLLLTQEAAEIGPLAEGPLVFENARFLPTPAEAFEPARPLFLYFQVYRPGEQAAQLYFDYQISDSEQVYYRSPLRELATEGGQGLSSHAYLLDLSSIEGGDYSLLLKVFDKASGQYTIRREPLRLEGGAGAEANQSR